MTGEYTMTNNVELFVSCPKCKNGESQPAEESRNHFGCFDFDYKLQQFSCAECQIKAKAEYYINEDSVDYVETFVRYHRNPTQGEIKFGEGAIHYKDFNEVDIINPENGAYKKWLICPDDGLRYYY